MNTAGTLFDNIHDEPDISRIGELLRSGALSSVGLVRQYLSRIEGLDRGGPALRSVLYPNPDALDIAESLDRELADKKARGPLHGIPVMIKSNIDSGDRMPTTAGSAALSGYLAPRDAPVVAALRKAGAVILAKTNLSEWSNFRSSQSSSGWSAEGGQTRNPYALDRNPSGSSSGSAVAVAANLCMAALGTETNGSIVSPSAVNGIVGLKPTVGLLPAEGIIPIAKSQDTAGPMTRTVRDAAILLAAIAGRMPRRWSDSQLDPPDRGMRMNGMRIGYAPRLAGFDENVDLVFAGALGTLDTLGAEIVQIDLHVSAELEEAERLLLLYEYKAGIETYLRLHGSPCGLSTVDDIVAYNHRHAARELSLFGQDTLIKAAVQGPLDSAEYRRIRSFCIRAARSQGIDAAMKAHRLDAITAPTCAPAWKTDYLRGDHYLGMSAALPAIAGYPHITVPAGWVGGLPVGLSLFGTAWSEPELLRIASSFEDATQARRPPTFPASAGCRSE